MIEEKCEDERYRSLRLEEDFVDVEKDEGREGAAIGFNYDQEGQQQNERPPLAPAIVVQDEPEPPSLRTLANVLEKTAEFIAKNGAQMEILMRAKEAGNPKFQFLNPDNAYHPIYKQVLEKKRQRHKNPYHYNQQNVGQTELSLEQLEASLKQLTRNLPSAAPNLLISSHGATEQCHSSPTYSSVGGSSAYSKLVEKIREKKAAAAIAEASSTGVSISSAGPSENSTPIPSPPPPYSVEEANITQIGSNESTKDDGSVIQVIPPPLEAQILIDKTASWICKQNIQSGNKNAGMDKLAVVKKMHKDEFEFLFPEGQYHTYFLYKVALYTEMLSASETVENPTEVNDLTASGGERTISQTNSIPHDEKKLAELTVKAFPTLKGFFNT